MSLRIVGAMSFKTVLIVILSSLCVCVLSIDSPSPSNERYSKSTLYVNMRDPEVVRMEGRQEILRFGDKLRRKEVISRRKDTSIVGDSGELEIQLPDGGVKAPNGKTLNKMVIRTFKTTTTTSTSTTTEVPKSEHYYNLYYPNRNKNKNKFTSTTSKPEVLSSAQKLTGADNNKDKYSSRKSTTERPTTREPQQSYSFPSFPKKEQQNQKKNGGTTRQYILRSSLPTKSTTPYTTSSTTVEVTTGTPSVQESRTEQPTFSEVSETTPVISTSTYSSSSSSDSSSPIGRPVKVISKTVSTVITTVKDSSYTPVSSTSEPILEEPKPSRKPIHYILAVIGPPKVPEAEQFEEETTTTISSQGEQSVTPSEVSTTSSTSSSPPVVTEQENIVPSSTSTPGPYDHLQTIEIPASAITDNSPPFDVIPSVGNAQPHYRPFSATRVPPTRFNYFDTQNYKQDFRPRQQQFPRDDQSPRLIPLQTVVSYSPDNSGNINRLTPPHEHSIPSASRSPFVSSKTVLFYTQVSPKDGSNSGDFPKFSANSVPSLNSLISESSGDQRNRIISQANPSTSSSSSNGLNAVPARSFYLDNLRLPVPSSVFGKPIPLVLNYSSV